MRNILPMLLLILFCPGVRSQTPWAPDTLCAMKGLSHVNVWQDCSSCTPPNDHVLVRRYAFDSNGLCGGWTAFMDGAPAGKMTVNRDLGRIISCIYRTSLFSSENGLRWDSTVVSTRVEFTYHPDGKLSRADCFEGMANAPYWRIEFTYDAKGRKTSELIHFWPDIQSAPIVQNKHCEWKKRALTVRYFSGKRPGEEPRLSGVESTTFDRRGCMLRSVLTDDAGTKLKETTYSHIPGGILQKLEWDTGMDGFGGYTGGTNCGEKQTTFSNEGVIQSESCRDKDVSHLTFHYEYVKR